MEVSVARRPVGNAREWMSHQYFLYKLEISISVMNNLIINMVDC